MTKIKITTTQNIDIEYELANVFERMIAWLIDFIVIIGYILIASVVAKVVFGDGSMGAIALVTPIALYHLLSETLLNGRSLGKYAMRIKVIRIDGSPPKLGSYLIRWFTRIIDCSPLFFYGSFGIGAVTLSSKGQRMGDLIAGTTVIKLDQETSISQTIFAPVHDEYQAVFPGVSSLNDKDINTLVDVLQLYRRERNIKLLNITANRICHFLNVRPGMNMNSEIFIQTIIRDYNSLN